VVTSAIPGLAVHAWDTIEGSFVVIRAVAMRPHTRTSFLALCVACSAGLATAAPRPAPAVGTIELPIQKARLENGLRVVMNPDHTAPNVAICVTYDVGARNEVPGRSGFAHLFEHMMFQGSRNVEKGGHFTLITARGGTLNGTTSSDRTNYFEVLPSNELALGLWLEADRMKFLNVTPENLENQRAVVQEEYRMRVSNNAYAEGHMKLSELVFQGYFPYEHDAIGKMEDLDAAKFEWVREFHESYYAPNNAVLSVVGDFEPDEAMRLIRDYFGDARAQPNIPPYEPPPLPEQTTTRTADVQDANAKTPGLYFGWVIPPYREAEHYALELAALLLGDGESSRLHQNLVRKDSVARSAAAWTRDHRGPDTLTIQVLLTERAHLGTVERQVQQEIDRLATRGPTPQEMTKAKNRVTSYFAFGLQSNGRRAAELAEFELYFGDARLLGREVAHYHAVTAQQVRDAVKKYLTAGRRSTVRVHPMSAQEGKTP
jgi:zinc protease